MNHAITLPDYLGIDKLIYGFNATSAALKQQYFKTLDSIVTHWQKKLGAHKVCIVNFILNRTLKFGKIAEKIPFPAFSGGVSSEQVGQICSGLDISEMTLRKCLKELSDDGFIHVYFPEKAAGKMDRAIRFYEINFKKLQHLTHNDGEIMGILREPRDKKGVKVDDENSETRPLNLGDLRTYNRLTKVNQYRSAPPATAATVETSLKSISKPSDKLAAILQDMEQRQAVMKEKAAARRAKRATASTESKNPTLTIPGMQAKLDELMGKYFPQLPRLIVTGIPLGKMKKSIALSTPDDLDAFLDWTIRNWPELADQQQRAADRRIKNGEPNRGTVMPRSPQFDALAYRYNYFIKAYSTYLVERGALGDRTDRVKEENVRLRKALANKEVEVRNARRVTRETLLEAKERQREAQAPKRVPRTVRQDDDGYLPSWEEAQQQVKRKA